MASMSSTRPATPWLETEVDIRILNYSRRYPTNDEFSAEAGHRDDPRICRVRIAQRRSRQRQPFRGSVGRDCERYRASEDVQGRRGPREALSLRVPAGGAEAQERANTRAGPLRYGVAVGDAPQHAVPPCAGTPLGAGRVRYESRSGIFHLRHAGAAGAGRPGGAQGRTAG